MEEKIDETLVQLLNREISKPDAVEQLTAIACTNQSPNVNEALKAAVNAIYFNDNSDYATALYEVIYNLTGDKNITEKQICKLFNILNSEK